MVASAKVPSASFLAAPRFCRLLMPSQAGRPGVAPSRNPGPDDHEVEGGVRRSLCVYPMVKLARHLPPADRGPLGASPPRLNSRSVELSRQDPARRRHTSRPQRTLAAPSSRSHRR
jgi:hypothetical protein